MSSAASTAHADGPRHYTRAQLAGVDPAAPVVEGIDLGPMFRWSPAEFAEILANPLHGDELPLLFVHLEQGRPVSRIEAVGDRLIHDQGSLPWVWFCNFATLSSHQGQRIGTRLLQYMIQTADRLGFGIGAPPSRPGSLAAYRIAGMPEATPLRRQVVPLALNAVAGTLIKPGWLAAPLAALGNAGLGVHRGLLRWLRRGQALTAVECTSVMQIPESLFAGVLPPLHFQRSPDQWQWRWERCQRLLAPGRDYRLLRLDRSDGQAVGALMLRRAGFDRPGGIPADDLPVVTVLDWLLAEPTRAAYLALMQAGLRAALDMGGEVLEFATGDPGLARALHSSGFIRAGGYRMFLHCDSGLADRLQDSERFYWEACQIEDNFTW